MRYSLLFFSLLLIACNQESLKQKREAQAARSKFDADSIAQAKRVNDSISIVTLASKKIVYIGDKTVSLVEKPTLSKKVKFEYEFGEYNNYWRELLAERQRKFLTIRIKLTSKSKLNGKESHFFPNLNVFSIDEEAKKISLVGEMEYKLYKKSELGIAYLEQIYNYKESETFTCILEVDDNAKRPLVISVNKSKINAFDGKSVIGIVM